MRVEHPLGNMCFIQIEILITCILQTVKCVFKMVIIKSFMKMHFRNLK